MKGTMYLDSEVIEATYDEFEEVITYWKLAREGTASRLQRYYHFMQDGKRTVIDLASLGSLSFSEAESE